MSIKTKISLALTFLFVILLMLGGLSAYYLNRVSSDAGAILQDNYNSLEYVSAMQRALTDRPNPDALTDFETALSGQEANVTEVSEGRATRLLRRAFDQYRRGATDSLTVGRIEQSLLTIADLNRQAMIRKNETAKETSRQALKWLALVGTASFLVLFSFIINFPGYIANPLRELTRGIREVASRNFEERLHFRSEDEFGELARSFNSMAQKLDEFEHSNLAQVLHEKRRIETLIQIMSEGIIGLDENRWILFVNNVACRLLGAEQSALLGRYAPDLAAQNDLLRTLIQDVMSEPDVAMDNTARDSRALLKIYDPAPDSAEGRGKEGYYHRRTHRVEVTRTGEVSAELAGYVIVLENVTSYKELDLAKTNFIATVSHELKTPLAGIKMSLKLLEDARVGALNTEQQSLLAHVRADADRLLNLTAELLNMAQVESGQIQLKLRPVVPADIVHYAMHALRLQAEQKQLRIVESVPDGLPPVLADAEKASWVLINFLSNAIRHSAYKGIVEVSVALLADENRVQFKVRDYGVGVRPEHQPLVFERYFKVPEQAGQSGGTGLGLAISREFIGSMHGQIGLDADVSDGAAFYFRLPVSTIA